MAGVGERHSQESRNSEVTVSTPPPISRLSPDHGSPAIQYTQSLLERMQKDTCFRCGKQGHWAQDCVSSTPTRAPPPRDIHQECPGSIVTVSTPLPISRLSPDHGSPAIQYTQSLLERMQKDTCFRCGKQGHWAQDCVSSTPTRAPPPQDIHQECPGSIVTVSTPPPISRLSPDHGSPAAHDTQSLLERMQKDTCFRCGKQGHWAQYCVSSTPTKASPPQDIHQLPVLRCHCGVTYTINVSHSKANPGRRYYSSNCNCNSDNKATRGKNFFRWCDEVTAPMCKCGAGACTVNLRRDNEGKETRYYTCRIREGHGACGFLQPDSTPNSWPKSSEKDKRSSIMSPPNGEPTNIMAHKDECHMPSLSNRDMVVRETETCNSVMGKGQCVSRLLSQSDIRSRQIELWNQISTACNSPDRCEVFQMLGFHFHGWMGRLVFPPPRIIEEALPRHFFCLLVSAYADISDRGGSSSAITQASSNAEVNENALKNDTQLPSVPLRTSRLKRSSKAMKTDVTNPTMREVRKKPQKDVLSLLESMEPADHDTISHATNATSDAPASAESIQFTSGVPQMASTLQDNCNLQVPTINISGIHAKAFAALKAASGNIQSVHKVAAHMHGQFEKLETCFLDIAKDMGQLKRRMQATCQKLTEALKLQEEEEEQVRIHLKLMK